MNLRIRFVVLYVVLAGMAAYMSFHRDLIVPLARPFAEFPPVHAGWRMAGQSSLSENVIKVLMPTDYLSRRYVAEDGTIVDIYLSFFDGGPDSGGIHSPKHCMPGSGWFEMSTERMAMELGGETVSWCGPSTLWVSNVSLSIIGSTCSAEPCPMNILLNWPR